MLQKLTFFSISYPKTVIVMILTLTLLFMSQFPKIKIDTDPENMLEPDQTDRIFYDEVKKRFGIHDLIVLGITDEQSIFNPQTLKKIGKIASEIVKIKGVIIEDVISFTTTDNVKSEGGILEVRPIMSKIPNSSEEIEDLKREIYDNPLFVEKIVSMDGTGAAMYIPIQKKDMSYRISREIEEIVRRELDGGQKYYLAGLPVAEDTFGHEMFKQMGMTAPLTGLVIFLLMLLLFRKISLIISPMIVAMFSVAWAMGLLIGMGFTVHIMSSMIPVFLMPIAVLDSVHILSEFYDRYPSLRDRKKTLMAVTDELFTPMLYTSLTSAVGFASLTLARIPPVRVFGVFVALGIMAAWLLTVTLIPASIMLIREGKLERTLTKKAGKRSLLDKVLPPVGRFAFLSRRLVLVMGAILLTLGVLGVSKVIINDNPVKWFKEGHKIRVADTAMNRLFGGTYMAYLVAEGETEGVIKKPEIIAYLDKLQKKLERNKIVGKTSSIADIVKRVNYVLHDGKKDFYSVPKTLEEVGQFLFLFLSSGDPDDLDNFVDYDYRYANIWVQMRKGENKSMEEVKWYLEDFTRQTPPPAGIKLRWSGLTYINKVWQDLMVRGMLKAILGSFAVVLILMVILFRSVGLGLISMVPLTFAIVLSYGIVGFVGKDYDMPIAVCSSLSLGLAIDFAIHFIQRFKRKYSELGSLEKANGFVFGEPVRAISRNALVIVLGFLPLTLSTLTPYVTVGIFFASLMVFSSLATFFLLPALMGTFGSRILKGGR